MAARRRSARTLTRPRHPPAPLRLIPVRDDFGSVRVRPGEPELSQPVDQPLDAAGNDIDLEILRIVMAAADAGIDRDVKRWDQPAARATLAIV